MAGRRPKPTAVKELSGNPGKRALNREEPVAFPGEPPMPEFLTDIARAEWRRIVPLLLDMKVLKTCDGAALASYCMSFARWQQAEDLISRHGVVVEELVYDDEGEVIGTKLKKNPACNVSMAEKKEMRAALALFGLDPSSRSRIKGAPDDKPASPLAKILQMRAQARAGKTA